MPTSTNDYLARLGLNKDPFSDEVDADFYYENPELMQRLDMIQHLIGFSNQLIFVSGAHGIGKTAMLDRLEYYAPDHWRICRIEANPLMNTPTLLKQLTSGFGVEVHAQNDDLFEASSNALEDHISQLERAMHTPVLLIDNAHELPVDAFILLFGFMQQDSKSHLKMALFCEPQIKTMLDSPQLRMLSDQIVHHLDIPELNESRTREYLEKRLQFAGLEGEFPFLPDTLRRIHRLSEGLPARINTLAEQALLDEDSQALPVVDEVLSFSEEELDPPADLDDSHSGKAAPIGRRFQSWQIGAVAVVMALLAAVLWITSKLNDEQLPAIAEDVPLDLNSAQEIPAVNEQADEPGAVYSQDIGLDLPISGEISDSLSTDHNTAETFEESLPVTPITETVDQTSPDGTDPMDALVEELEAAHKANVIQKSTVISPETSADKTNTAAEQAVTQPVKTESTSKSEVEKQTTAEARPPKTENTGQNSQQVESEPVQEASVSTPVISTPATNEAPLSSVKSVDWIRQQADNHFFLQLLGTHDMAALQKFFAENQTSANLAWFTTQHEGEPWYVVVQGPYENRASAVASIASLPAEYQKRKPWPRSVTSIKQIMLGSP